MSDSLENLRIKLAEFAQRRDWNQFHSPKNLSMALIVEAAELVEHFQWLSEQQSYELIPEKHQKVSMELADILLYIIRISDKLNVDLIESAEKKIAINEQRYPVDKVRGSNKKYNEY